MGLLKKAEEYLLIKKEEAIIFERGLLERYRERLRENREATMEESLAYVGRPYLPAREEIFDKILYDFIERNR